MKSLLTITLIIIFSFYISSCKKDKNDDNNDNQNNPTLPIAGPNVSDTDGNVYHSVVIGTQTWMTENLKTTKYRDGTPIPNIVNDSIWNSLTTGARCDNSHDTNNSITYGRLYNWYAVTDTHNLAPQGWHIPSHSEWNILGKFLDNSIDTNNFGYNGTTIGYLLKESGNTHWHGTNEANNESGFTALPAGCLTPAGMYPPGGQTYWWSTAQNVGPATTARGLTSDSYQIIIQDLYKTDGLSVRCIKD
jgi:uncharacterized protein (TIGR02145 family)